MIDFISQAVVPEIQIFKFVYAIWLAELGQVDRALQYVETILEVVQKTARGKGSTGYIYPPTFMSQLSSFEDRLRKASDEVIFDFL